MLTASISAATFALFKTKKRQHGAMSSVAREHYPVCRRACSPMLRPTNLAEPSPNPGCQQYHALEPSEVGVQR